MKIGVCGNSTIQHKYKNCYFFRKSSGIMYLALAVAPATCYNRVDTKINNVISIFSNLFRKTYHAMLYHLNDLILFKPLSV